MDQNEAQYQISLKESDLKNLSVFLDRVELKGQEVSCFLEIQKALFSAKKVFPEKSDSPKNLEEMKVKKDDGIPVSEIE